MDKLAEELKETKRKLKKSNDLLVGVSDLMSRLKKGKTIDTDLSNAIDYWRQRAEVVSKL